MSCVSLRSASSTSRVLVSRVVVSASRASRSSSESVAPFGPAGAGASVASAPPSARVTASSRAPGVKITSATGSSVPTWHPVASHATSTTEPSAHPTHMRSPCAVRRVRPASRIPQRARATVSPCSLRWSRSWPSCPTIAEASMPTSSARAGLTARMVPDSAAM